MIPRASAAADAFAVSHHLDAKSTKKHEAQRRSSFTTGRDMNKGNSNVTPDRHIRPARLEDAESIARVQIDTWHTTYRGIVPDSFLTSMSYEQNTERWSKLLKVADEQRLQRVTLVAETERTGVVGFASGGPERDGQDGYDGELYALYLLSEHQGRGIGAGLVREFMRGMKAIGFHSILVWVLAENPTRNFYEHMGGIEVRRKTIEIGGAELEEIGYGLKLGV